MKNLLNNVVKVRPNGASLIATIPKFICTTLSLEPNEQLIVSVDKDSRSFTFKVANIQEINELMARQFEGMKNG